MINAAPAGFGLAYVPEDFVRPHLANGRLKRVLEDWCPLYSGYHLYFSLCLAGRCATLPGLKRLTDNGRPLNVDRFWHLADIGAGTEDVRC